MNIPKPVLDIQLLFKESYNNTGWVGVLNLYASNVIKELFTPVEQK